MGESEMVERVARAIYASHAFNDNHDSPDPGFDGLTEGWRNVMYANARAAIEAMRAPTEVMKYVGGTKCEDMLFGGDADYTGIIFTDMGTVFRTMIDVALTERLPTPPDTPSSPERDQ